MVRLLRTMAPFRVSKRTGVAEHRLRNTHVVYILQANEGALLNSNLSSNVGIRNLLPPAVPN